jgi:hypothetical protein
LLKVALKHQKSKNQIKSNHFWNHWTNWKKQGRNVQLMVYLIFWSDQEYATFNSISVISWVSFIGGGNRRTRRKPLTCRKSLTNLSTFRNVQLMVYLIFWSDLVWVFCGAFVAVILW